MSFYSSEVTTVSAMLEIIRSSLQRHWHRCSQNARILLSTPITLSHQLVSTNTGYESWCCLSTAEIHAGKHFIRCICLMALHIWKLHYIPFLPREFHNSNLPSDLVEPITPGNPALSLFYMAAPMAHELRLRTAQQLLELETHFVGPFLRTCKLEISWNQGTADKWP